LFFTLIERGEKMNNLVKTIGERVRYFRLYRGFTQEELAEKANVHYTYIGGIERGERNISLETLNKITEALEISPTDLFEQNFLKKETDKTVLLKLHQELLSTRSTEEIIIVHQLTQSILHLIDRK